MRRCAPAGDVTALLGQQGAFGLARHPELLGGSDLAAQVLRRTRVSVGRCLSASSSCLMTSGCSTFSDARRCAPPRTHGRQGRGMCAARSLGSAFLWRAGKVRRLRAAAAGRRTTMTATKTKATTVRFDPYWWPRSAPAPRSSASQRRNSSTTRHSTRIVSVRTIDQLAGAGRLARSHAGIARNRFVRRRRGQAHLA